MNLPNYQASFSYNSIIIYNETGMPYVRVTSISHLIRWSAPGRGLFSLFWFESYPGRLFALRVSSHLHPSTVLDSGHCEEIYKSNQLITLYPYCHSVLIYLASVYIHQSHDLTCIRRLLLKESGTGLTFRHHPYVGSLSGGYRANEQWYPPFRSYGCVPLSPECHPGMPMNTKWNCLLY